MAKITLINVTSTNNGGDGVRIEGNINVDVNGLITHGNGGKGLNIIQSFSLMEELGMPKNTDPLLIVELLTKLQKPATDIEKEKIITRSGLGQFLKKQGINMTTITANLLSIAGSQGVQQVIQSLSKSL
jgi:hypothetical protein